MQSGRFSVMQDASQGTQRNVGVFYLGDRPFTAISSRFICQCISLFQHHPSRIFSILLAVSAPSISLYLHHPSRFFCTIHLTFSHLLSRSFSTIHLAFSCTIHLAILAHPSPASRRLFFFLRHNVSLALFRPRLKHSPRQSAF